MTPNRKRGEVEKDTKDNPSCNRVSAATVLMTALIAGGFLIANNKK